jgi:carbon storage regulator
MLVFSRKTGEEIVVPSCRLSISVLDIGQNRVSLGITAPREVSVHRREVWKRIQQESNHPQETAAMSGPRVLIADPSEYLLNFYRDHLAQRGFHVETAVNGLDCVRKLQDFRPEALVLEPCMPWGGGDGVLAVMHEDPDVPVVPVMILTYGCDSAMLYNISPYPISDFQKKPVTAKRLVDRLSLILLRQQESRIEASGNKARYAGTPRY